MSSHLLVQSLKYANKEAILSNGKVARYVDLQKGALSIAKKLLNGKSDLNQKRIAFISEPSAMYVQMQWGIWAAGGIAVPLHRKNPIPELQYVLSDTQSSFVLTDTTNLETIQHTECKSNQVLCISEEFQDTIKEVTWDVGNFDVNRAAQILYTSGTTGQPKGVVTTHGNIMHQINDIVTAWELTSTDRLLHFLPLHHTHGILVKLLCPLAVGATVDMMPSADARLIWEKIAASEGKLSLFMAVPTIYMKMLEQVDQLPSDLKTKAIQYVKQMRLTVSGSMACPVRIINEWEKLTGHRLLERYGMTELGMVLTNSLHGERHAGFVGKPFPSVHVRIDPESGELRVKGPSVFREYFNRPTETAKEFDSDGWFKTGDIVEFDSDRESYKIIGRASVDIIKYGGYKLSAVEIEASLLEFPHVAECYVLGIEDETWGQKVLAVVRFSTEDKLEELKKHAAQCLAPYKIPREWICMSDIPKNAMGKVNKKALRRAIADRFNI